MSGILLLDKPEGPTSTALVRRVARLWPGAKVGHLGTLDPFASGLLPLCIGEATKIARFLNMADKEYEGVIRLGSATDTGDRTGTVVHSGEVPEVTDRQCLEIARHFTGALEQVPPMYSAIKRNGVPLYKLARRGIEVDRTARRVEITALEVTRHDESRLGFRVSCSKGTYIRVLAEDIGTHLGSFAHLETLRRTRFGGFHLKDAVSIEEWSPASGAGLVSIREALAGIPAVTVTERQAEAVRHGQGWVLSRLEGLPCGEHALLVDALGGVVAVLSNPGDGWKLARVLGREGDSLQGPGPVLTRKTKLKRRKDGG